ncbi:hypothetical protein Tco_0030898 [Tanacetum coccineum]
MEKNKRRKARDHEVLLAQEAGEAQEWNVEGEVYEDGVEAGLPRETVSDDIDEEIKYESDGVQIIEQYGPDEDGASI